MRITSLGQIWYELKKKPAVSKAEEVVASEHLLGSSDESREHGDFSEKKKADAMTHYMTYDGQGHVHDDAEEHPHPKIDTYE